MLLKNCPRDNDEEPKYYCDDCKYRLYYLDQGDLVFCNYLKTLILPIKEI